jgi:dienelactone hydrolase
VPAVIVAHGSGGVSEGREGAWAARIVGWGYAAFVVDSFSPRGIRETATDQSQLSTFANVADAFAALAWLAKDPRIDTRRIAIMGFSKGAVVALHTATEPLRSAAGIGALRFAAHIALYPGCDVRYWSARQSQAPILMLLAGDDDYTPPATCRTHAEDLRRVGAVVALESYPGARHGFDRPNAVRFSSQVETVRGCAAVYDMDRRFWSMALGGPEVSGREIGAYFRSCRSRGAHIGGQAAALEGSITAIKGQLARAFE